MIADMVSSLLAIVGQFGYRFKVNKSMMQLHTKINKFITFTAVSNCLKLLTKLYITNNNLFNLENDIVNYNMHVFVKLYASGRKSFFATIQLPVTTD